MDKVSSVGTIPVDDEKIDDFKVTYRRGPVKLLERALNKAQNHYSDKEYPTSACVLDLNRCSLIFDDINSLEMQWLKSLSWIIDSQSLDNVGSKDIGL